MANIKIRTRSGAGQHLVRPRPQEDGHFGLWVSDADRFSAYVHADVLDFIKRNGDTAAPHETIGLLAGRVCHDPVNGPYTLVMAAENAMSGEFESGPGHVKLKGIGQTHLRRRLEEAHPDREIVGWYHTHPNHQPVFSPVDAKEQQTWNDQNSIGIVYSTDGSGAESFGVYRGPHSVRLRPAREIPTRTIPTPQQLLPADDAPPQHLTPRPEPLELKENVILTTPAARSMRMKILIFSLVAIIYLAPVFGLYRLDRRLAFAEGRLHQLSVMSPAYERPREPAPAPSSSPAPVTSESSAAQTDGPELRVPVKPLTPAPRQQSSPTRRQAQTPPSRHTTTPNKKTAEKTAKKSDKSTTQKPTTTAASTSNSKPAKEPIPKATPK